MYKDTYIYYTRIFVYYIVYIYIHKLRALEATSSMKTRDSDCGKAPAVAASHIIAPTIMCGGDAKSWLMLQIGVVSLQLTPRILQDKH